MRKFAFFTGAIALASSALATDDGGPISLAVMRDMTEQPSVLRVPQIVFDTSFPGFFGTGNSKVAYDEVNFTPGPGAGALNVVVDALSYGIYVPNTVNPTESVTMRFTFYPTHNPSPSPATLPPYSGTPFGTATHDFGTVAPNPQGTYISYFPNPVTFNGGTLITVPSSPFGLLCEALSTGTSNYHGACGPASRGGSYVLSAGSSDFRRWLDTSVPLDNAMASTEFSGTSTADRRDIYLRIRGDVPPPPPPPAQNLGTLADGANNVSSSVATGAVKWFRFDLVNFGASDAALTFLDLDTEGTAAVHANDVTIALYDTSGNLVVNVGFDNDSGTGTDDQLTYGVGIRAAPGDGRQYNGRNGELAPGTYFLAVAPVGTGFGGSFNVVPSASPGGNFNLRLTTNHITQVLAPSVAPFVTDNAGLLTDAGWVGLNQATGRFDYYVSGFEICADADDADGLYVDVDFSASFGIADAQAHVFDSTGTLVAASDDADADGVAPVYIKPQFSWGDVGPRPNIDPLAQQFAGQDGTLPDGVYYIIIGLFPNTPLVSGDRWHVRSGSGSDLPCQADYYTNYVDGDVDGTPDVCAGNPCPGDINGDGQIGLADLSAMLGSYGLSVGNPGYNALADLNGDNTVSLADLSALLAIYGTTCP